MFIDSSGDIAILNKYGMNGIAKAIVNGVLGTSSNVTPSKPSTDNNEWVNLDGKTGTINTPSGVNIREKKSTSSKILGLYLMGEKYNYIAKKEIGYISIIHHMGLCVC